MMNSGAIPVPFRRNRAIPVPFRWIPVIPVPFLRIPVPFRSHSAGFRWIPAELPDSGWNLWGTKKYSLWGTEKYCFITAARGFEPITNL